MFVEVIHKKKNCPQFYTHCLQKRTCIRELARYGIFNKNGLSTEKFYMKIYLSTWFAITKQKHLSNYEWADYTRNLGGSLWS